MRIRFVVALLGIIAIAVLAASLSGIRLLTHHSFSGAMMHRETSAISASSARNPQHRQGEQPLPRALITLQSPEPPSLKAVQSSADAANEAAREAADTAARN